MDWLSQTAVSETHLSIQSENTWQSATREFLWSQLPNPNTRLAYSRAVAAVIRWFAARSLFDPVRYTSAALSSWLSEQLSIYSLPTVKLQLAAVRMWLDWLVTSQVIPRNPAQSIKAPRYSIAKGRTPVLSPEEARGILDCISGTDPVSLRDRALIGTMLYTFARIGAVLRMTVADVYTQERRLWVRLHEKGGKLLLMPCHHQLEQYLTEYMQAILIDADPPAPLFPSYDRSTGQIGRRNLPHANAYQMVQRRARQAGIKTHITNHSFRATGITTYLENGGTLEMAAKLAGHSSTKTTQLYDRRSDKVTLSEIERIRL